MIPVITVLLTAVISFLLANRPEKEALQNAKPLTWRRITMQEKEAVRKNSETSFLYMLILIAVWAVLCLLAGFLAGHSLKEKLLLGLCFLFPAMVLILAEELKKLFWFHIDDSAECAQIQIHHTYKIKFYGRIGTSYSRYAVFYTPEGKFRAKYDLFPGNKIYLIRFRGRFRYYFPDEI